jgi:hypothetical protein
LEMKLQFDVVLSVSPKPHRKLTAWWSACTTDIAFGAGRMMAVQPKVILCGLTYSSTQS